jgi:hypothetical protein
MVSKAELVLEVKQSGVKQATNDLNSMSAAAGRTQTTAKASGDAAQKSSYQYRMAAMQLSQVASQGSVTGNYLQALAIQLPDLALGFGTLGIVIGSVAGALAVPLFNSLGAAGKGIDDLSEEVLELSGLFEEAENGSYGLSEELVRLAKISESAAQLRIAIETESARQRILEIGTLMSDEIAVPSGIAADEQERLGEAIRNAIQSTDIADYTALAKVGYDLETSYQAATNAARENWVELRRKSNEEGLSRREQYNLRKETEAAKDEYFRLNGILGDVTVKIAKYTEAGVNAAATYGKLVSSGEDWDQLLEKNNETLLSSYNAMSAYLGGLETLESKFLTAQEEVTEERLEQQYILNEALANGLISHQEYNDLRLKSDQQYAIQSAQIEIQRAQAVNNVNNLILSQFQNFAQTASSALESYGKENSRLGKAMLFANKAMMVGQAYMAAEMSAVQTFAAYTALAAATSNPALVEVGRARATMARAAGYASAALIAATEFGPGRELGGQVKAGKSYMVGERGPEMITMGADGHITANKNLGGGAPKVEIINNGQPVSAEATMDGDTLKIILDAAEDRINSNIAAGRSTARIMQSAYGLRRAGR